MPEDKRQTLIESHRMFIEGAFGIWLQQQLEEKVKYHHNSMMGATCWDGFVEARSKYEAATQMYNMVVNPQQFFN